MPSYKVIYTETLVHAFYVDAANEADAEQRFHKGVQEGRFDFSDGEVTDSSYVIKEVDNEQRETD